jgi:hypothetical protein
MVAHYLRTPTPVTQGGEGGILPTSLDASRSWMYIQHATAQIAPLRPENPGTESMIEKFDELYFVFVVLSQVL